MQTVIVCACAFVGLFLGCLSTVAPHKPWKAILSLHYHAQSCNLIGQTKQQNVIIFAVV